MHCMWQAFQTQSVFRTSVLIKYPRHCEGGARPPEAIPSLEHEIAHLHCVRRKCRRGAGFRYAPESTGLLNHRVPLLAMTE